MKNEFPILVLERGNQFVCLVKELSLLEQGEDLSKTYEKVKEQREQLLAQMKEMQLEGVFLKEPLTKKRWNFSLNVLLATLLLIVPISSLTIPAARIINRISKLFDQPIELFIDLGKRLENMPPKKQEELKHSIQVLVSQLEVAEE